MRRWKNKTLALGFELMSQVCKIRVLLWISAIPELLRQPECAFLSASSSWEIRSACAFRPRSFSSIVHFASISSFSSVTRSSPVALARGAILGVVLPWSSVGPVAETVDKCCGICSVWPPPFSSHSGFLKQGPDQFCEVRPCTGLINGGGGTLLSSCVLDFKTC